MSGPGFGFSVGDFIAAIEIVSKVIRALKQTGGASSRYVQVLSQLENLSRILQQLERLVPNQDDAYYINAIRGVARSARYPLDEFLLKIEQFEPALNPANRQKISKRAFKATKWALLIEDEVEKLRLRLVAYLLTLSLQLQLRELCVGDVKEARRKLAHEETLTAIQGQKDALDRLSTAASAAQIESRNAHKATMDAIASVQMSSQASTTTIQDVKKIALSLADQASHAFADNKQSYQHVVRSVVSNTEQLVKLQQDVAKIPALQIDSCIYLVDALDRAHKLPYEHFQDFTLVHTHLSSRLKDIPGWLQVKAGLYQLVREGRHSKIINSEDWSRSIFPGSRVSMAIMLSSLRLPNSRCPRPNCHQEVRARDLARMKIQCERCALVYYPYSPSSVTGSERELQAVLRLQTKVDKGQFGRRHPPKDLSIIASISGGTISLFSQPTKSLSAFGNSTHHSDRPAYNRPRSDAPLPYNPGNASNRASLTQENLDLWEENVDTFLTQQKLAEPPRDSSLMQLPSIDWNSDPSGMIAWLNQSANQETGNQPPPIEPLPGYESDSIDEEEDLEVLRRVCIARSIPAATHYLDAPDYANIAVQTIPYLRKIIDKYPKLPALLARRLAEKNQFLVDKLARCVEESKRSETATKAAEV